MVDVNGIWASTVTRMDIQLETMTLRLDLKVLDFGQETFYVMECAGFSDLRITNAVELPWDYAELTEASAERRADGNWEIELVLWDEDCSLTCICESYSVEEASPAS